MAKQRMAGEKLAEEMSKADRHKRARERIAADPERAAARLEMVDRDKYDVADFSDKDIIMAFQGGDFGDKDYARLTGKDIGGGKPDPVVEDEVVVTPATPASVVVDNSNQGPGAGIADLVAVIDALPKGGGTGSGGGTGNRIKQVQSFDRSFGDNYNTIGDNAVIYGNTNQGNMDTSFNFGYQRNF